MSRRRAISCLWSNPGFCCRESVQGLQKKTEKIGDEHKAAREKQLADVREQNKIILERMNSLYAEKKEEWISQIVDGVLSSREV